MLLRLRPSFPWLEKCKIQKFTHFDAALASAREMVRLRNTGFSIYLKNFKIEGAIGRLDLYPMINIQGFFISAAWLLKITTGWRFIIPVSHFTFFNWQIFLRRLKLL
jgi:hypothetical protein